MVVGVFFASKYLRNHAKSIRIDRIRFCDSGEEDFDSERFKKRGDYCARRPRQDDARGSDAETKRNIQGKPGCGRARDGQQCNRERARNNDFGKKYVDPLPWRKN